MQDRVRTVAKLRSLVGRRHETSAPIARAADRFAGIAHDDEAGQVLVLAAESVADPGAEAGPARRHRAGIHLADRADMVQTVRPARPDHRQVVGAAGNMGQEIADVDSSISILLEAALACQERVAAGPHWRDDSAEAGRQLLPVPPRQLGFWIKCLQMTWAAFHEEEDHRPGSGRDLWRLRAERVL